jgi:hypothetical protein
MFTTEDVFLVYRDLADFHDQQGLGTLRDRFLVLAAATAQAAGRTEEAEQLRQRLLQGNAFHMLRPFASMAQALTSPDVQTYIEELRQEYPPQAAEDLLASVRTSTVPPRRGSPRPLPPTAPVINLDDPTETLKVFPNQEEPNVPTLPAWEDPPRKSSFPSARPVKLLPATAAARPATVPVKRLLGQQPSRPSKRGRASGFIPEEEDDVSGRWVGPVLAMIVFAVGVYLAAATLLRPFWP